MARQKRSYTAAFKAQVALAAIKGDSTANELAARHARVRASVWPGDSASLGRCGLTKSRPRVSSIVDPENWTTG